MEEDVSKIMSLLGNEDLNSVEETKGGAGAQALHISPDGGGMVAKF
jgi:hypothetical protein